MFYRNWPEICKEPNKELRIFLAMADRQALLARLAEGFPHLVCTEKVPLRVPASALLQAEYKRDVEEGSPRTFISEEALEKFGIPFHVMEGLEEEEGEIPRDLIQQLVGQTIGLGMRVNVGGVDYIATFVSFIRPEQIGNKLEKFPEEADLEFLLIELVEKQYIDLES